MQPGSHKIYKAVTFIFIFCLLFNEASTILQKKWPGRTATEIRFHSEPKNSIDVLFVGSSSFYRGISPLVLWNEYGFTSYVLANSNQSPLAIYESIEDALKTQKVKLVVLDGIVMLREYDYSDYEAHIRKYVDPIPLSTRKLKLIYKFWQEDSELTIASFLFPIIRYHDRWMELSEEDYRPFNLNHVIDTKGQTNISYFIPLEYPEGYMEVMDSLTPLGENAKNYYDRLIQLCEKNNTRIIFVTLPRLSWDDGSYNSLLKYTSGKQIPYFDYSFPDEINKVGLDLRTDFLDMNHLNDYGAKKISIAIGEDILQMVSLPDHRDDPNFSTWNDLFAIYNATALDPSKLIMDTEKMKEIEEWQKNN